MKNGWVKITVSLMFIAATGVGVWAVIDKLDPGTLKVIVGLVLTLTIVVVVGGLFISKDLLQAYIIRRAIAQDDLSDMRQMAFIARLIPAYTPRLSAVASGLSENERRQFLRLLDKIQLGLDTLRAPGKDAVPA